MPDRVVPRTDEEPRLPPPPSLPRTAVAAATPPRRYLVVRGGEVVGSSRLEYPLGSGSAAGVLYPEPAYERVRPVFRLYRRAGEDRGRLREYVRERDGLGLRLIEAQGRELRAAVELISEWEDGRLFVHVAIDDPRYWRATR